MPGETRAELASAADAIEGDFERFEAAFGKAEARRHALSYVRGLMICPARKSIEPIAKSVGEGRVSGLQKFINIAPWKPGEVARQMQIAFAERFLDAPRMAGTGTVGVFTERGFGKKGARSAGVARQWNPATGRTENCQVGVFLNAVAAGETVLLGEQLYLPAEWWRDGPESQAGRDRVHIPKGMGYLTRGEIAAELIRRHSVRNLIPLEWLTTARPLADVSDVSLFLSQRYATAVVEVPKTLRFQVEPGPAASDPSGAPGVLVDAQTLGGALRAGAWRESGRGGGQIRECATFRARYETPAGLSPPAWLLLERATGPHQTSMTAYFSNAAVPPPVGVLALLAEARARVAGFFEESTTALGMGHYETRSWVGWHHHMTLVGLAHLLLTFYRSRAERGTDEPRRPDASG